MKNYIVKRYQKEHYSIWNDFISRAKNATFLFHRDFMDYHNDRFEDYSLMVFEEKKLVAVLPANRVGKVIYSHQGLSYGSIVIKKNIKINEYLILVATLMRFLNSNEIESIYLKQLPKIYNKAFSEEFDYVTYLMKGEIYRSDLHMVIDNEQGYKPNRNRLRALKVANEKGIEVRLENDYEHFWNQILIPNLKARYNVAPVHTLTEISLLAALFPNQIKLYNAYLSGIIKAGVVVFVMENVVHFQYSSGDEDRNDTASLDALFNFIIQKYSDKKYISFGNCSEENGCFLNTGLAYWKESFGAKSMIQNFIKISTKNYSKLESAIK
ncbi:GNAT family N-acetyltransferase [Flavobacterium sp. IMCC34518]|uniref:GNAT family N-acetyltransferase n=1 Tax=Flavobacterium sp. IMCC34518 TaxID=3003623 RepID=UPI00248239B1|nr:GNAT family N-acetyltransferase [Flavobacterium sp. IMCC34518]